MYAYDDDEVTPAQGDTALREPTGRRTLGPLDWIALIALCLLYTSDAADE